MLGATSYQIRSSTGMALSAVGWGHLGSRQAPGGGAVTTAARLAQGNTRVEPNRSCHGRDYANGVASFLLPHLSFDRVYIH